MASRKEQKERLKAERERREAEEQAKRRRQRLIQYGSAAAFLGDLRGSCVLIIISQSGCGGTGAGAGGDVQDVSLVEKQLKGIPAARHRARRFEVKGDEWWSSVTSSARSARQFSFQVAARPDLGCRSARGLRQLRVPPADRSSARSRSTRRRLPIAAGEQGRYWNFIELFYRNQGEERSRLRHRRLPRPRSPRAPGVPGHRRSGTPIATSSKWDSVLSRTQARGPAARVHRDPVDPGRGVPAATRRSRSSRRVEARSRPRSNRWSSGMRTDVT